MEKIAIIGMGVRGKIFAHLLQKYHKDAQLSAICDTDTARLAEAAAEFELDPRQTYSTTDEFFESGKIADGLIICSGDSTHFTLAARALKCGYHVLLEKPISADPQACEALTQMASQSIGRIFICHELRYADFARRIKAILDSGEFGSLTAIEQTESIGYYHYAHSYVRGNWRRSDSSGPILLTKSCHDLDLLCYFAGSRCRGVSSVGRRTYFTPENRPEGAADFCYKCALKGGCAFDCTAFYTQNRDWLDRAGGPADRPEAEIEAWLREEQNPYARCVFACDNDVCEHQVVQLNFENGVLATLNLSAFTAHQKRTIRLYCTGGELEYDTLQNELICRPFGKSAYTVGFSNEKHGGGDHRLLEDFIRCLRAPDSAEGLTEIDCAVESHRIAFAAEKSRTENGKLILLDIKNGGDKL